MLHNIRIIVAHDRCRGIGKNGCIPWNIPEDLKRFRHITNGNIVVMGRKTYESIPSKFRPLPNRFNIIMTSATVDNCVETYPNLFYCNSVDSVKKQIQSIWDTHGRKDVDIIGGTEIYKQWFDDVSILEVTEVDGEYQCDREFPFYGDRFERVWESQWYPQGFKYSRWLRKGASL
jgi:dihydrofolate reductase